MLEPAKKTLRGLKASGLRTIARFNRALTNASSLLAIVTASLWTLSGVFFLTGHRRYLFGSLTLGVIAFAAILLINWRKREGELGGSPAGLASVLATEKRIIEATRDVPENRGQIDAPRVGLALSGGGIRSATFNLGLIQALADLHLLSRIDYLSTVSGGGYIGSWLMQWTRRSEPGAEEAPEESTEESLTAAATLYLNCFRDDAGESNRAQAERARQGSQDARAVNQWLPDAVSLAAMLYVACSDCKPPSRHRRLIRRAFETPLDSDGMTLKEQGEAENWLSIVRLANQPARQGERPTSQHHKARIAAKAARVVDATRAALAGAEAERPVEADTIANLEKALAAETRALRRLERALHLRGIDKVEQQLADEASVSSPEPRPVAHLRDFSNYLTPRVGLLTADTWTTVATYVRNFAINLVLITATISMALLVPRVMRALGLWADTLLGGHANVFSQHWSLLAAALISTLAVLVIVQSLRLAALNQDSGEIWWTSQTAVQVLIVCPLGVASLLASHWLGSSQGTLGWERWAAVTAVAYALPWLAIGWVSTGARLFKASQKNEIWSLTNSVLALSGLAVGAGGGALLFKLNERLHPIDGWALMTLGPPIIMTFFTLSAVLLIGLAGKSLDDYLREWLARAGAWITIYSLGWLALVGIANYGPVLLAAAKEHGRMLLASGWLATSVGGVLAGNSQQQGGGKKWHGPILRVAPWVFILGLVLLLAWGLDAGLSRQHRTITDQWESFRQAARTTTVSESFDYRADGTRLRVERTEGTAGRWLGRLNEEHVRLLDLQLGIVGVSDDPNADWLRATKALGGWLLGLALVALVLGWRIDINEFSMHNYYRNRLVRAYLGASNPNRHEKTQPFTGMARSDDSPLGSAEAVRPHHLVNTALNLVGGDRLAWQQRKAASFVLSPSYSGFELPPSEGNPGREAAFRLTSQLDGLTLGTALAVSGAAASPNMGFRSSPALSLLLTVFNVRLGSWLGNPMSPSTWSRLTPAFALKSLLAELFGLTSLKSDYVYLSDGGHFENLGLYELVRRRCRFIISTDVGTDPNLAFSDLGNAIRKCRTDFGARIDIDVGTIKPGADGLSRRHCVVGRITYAPETPDGLPERGWLLYIKSSLTGDEPEDVLQYKNANEAFPHQSTVDQFFDEPQFESYRQLGRHIGQRVFMSASSSVKDGFTNWYSLFEDLQQRWYAPSAAVEASFSKHGQALDLLFARIRKDPWLKFLDAQIYRELDGDRIAPQKAELPSSETEQRAGFYFCSSLIQLMENVYLDLNFDDEYDHPDNRGWLHLFRRWARVPMMRATWAVTAGTFGARFQSFCERRLGLNLGHIGAPLQTKQKDIDRFVGRLPGPVLHQNRSLLTDSSVSWYELEVSSQGLTFPIGYAAVRSTTATKLIYFEIDSHLRQSGLAKRALRALHEALSGNLELVSKQDRLRGIDARLWQAFEHFYKGAA